MLKTSAAVVQVVTQATMVVVVVVAREATPSARKMTAAPCHYRHKNPCQRIVDDFSGRLSEPCSMSQNQMTS